MLQIAKVGVSLSCVRYSNPKVHPMLYDAYTMIQAPKLGEASSMDTNITHEKQSK
jgi:hypothetical protein